MVNRLIILAAVCSMVPRLAECQRDVAMPSRQTLEDLQLHVTEWERALAAINIEALAPGHGSQLQANRDACLGWLHTLAEADARLQRGPSLSGQARLLISVLSLEDGLRNYSLELGRAYEASSSARDGIGNLALKWMNQTGSIATEIQSFYESLNDSVMRNLDAADRTLQENCRKPDEVPERSTIH
jgi:hypothetical protein